MNHYHGTYESNDMFVLWNELSMNLNIILNLKRLNDGTYLESFVYEEIKNESFFSTNLDHWEESFSWLIMWNHLGG